MPCSSRLRAAVWRPAYSRKAAQRAVPMTVPPSARIDDTSDHRISLMALPPSTAPCHPSMIA